MTATKAAFDSYKIFYYTERPFAPFQAMIYCYRGLEYVGRIVFYPDANVPVVSVGELHYAFSRFNDVLNVLRYESRFISGGIVTSTEKKRWSGA